MRLPFSRRHAADPSYGITTADTSHLDDISKRQRQYVYTMLFRVVAILVVVLVPGLTLLERAVLGLVATIIPYVAVIRANGGPDLTEAPTNMMIGPPRQGELSAPDRVLGGAHRIDAEDDVEYGEAGGEGGSGGSINEDGYGDGDAAADPPRTRFVEYGPDDTYTVYEADEGYAPPTPSASAAADRESEAAEAAEAASQGEHEH